MKFTGVLAVAVGLASCVEASKLRTSSGGSGPAPPALADVKKAEAIIKAVQATTEMGRAMESQKKEFDVTCNVGTMVQPDQSTIDQMIQSFNEAWSICQTQMSATQAFAGYLQKPKALSDNSPNYEQALKQWHQQTEVASSADDDNEVDPDLGFYLLVWAKKNLQNPAVHDSGAAGDKEEESEESEAGAKVAPVPKAAVALHSVGEWAPAAVTFSASLASPSATIKEGELPEYLVLRCFNPAMSVDVRVGLTNCAVGDLPAVGGATGAAPAIL